MVRGHYRVQAWQHPADFGNEFFFRIVLCLKLKMRKKKYFHRSDPIHMNRPPPESEGSAPQLAGIKRKNRVTYPPFAAFVSVGFPHYRFWFYKKEEGSRN